MCARKFNQKRFDLNWKGSLFCTTAGRHYSGGSASTAAKVLCSDEEWHFCKAMKQKKHSQWSWDRLTLVVGWPWKITIRESRLDVSASQREAILSWATPVMSSHEWSCNITCAAKRFSSPLNCRRHVIWPDVHMHAQCARDSWIWWPFLLYWLGMRKACFIVFTVCVYTWHCLAS